MGTMPKPSKNKKTNVFRFLQKQLGALWALCQNHQKSRKIRFLGFCKKHSHEHFAKTIKNQEKTVFRLLQKNAVL
jgi:predicted aldo/keto reductase-like oxidoreductase